MPVVTLQQWNEFIEKHPNAHILQTGAWGELKFTFGWQPVRLISGQCGVQILLRKLPLGLTIAYLPKPLPFDHFENAPAFWHEIQQVCRKHRAVFLKIEPDRWQSEGTVMPGFTRSQHNIQPPNTIAIDLTADEETILARMKQKTRYNIRLAAKKDVTVRVWDDVPAFHQMMLVTGGRDGFGVHSLAYYQRAYQLFQPQGMAELLVAEYAGKPLAALMVFLRGGRAWYMYGASTDEERNRMPAYALQWEAMRWARERGAQEYDLWGVPDAEETHLEAEFTRRSDGLWGVYRFKRGFGGQVKRAAQAQDRVYNPLMYRLYLWRMAGREQS